MPYGGGGDGEGIGGSFINGGSDRGVGEAAGGGLGGRGIVAAETLQPARRESSVFQTIMSLSNFGTMLPGLGNMYSLAKTFELGSRNPSLYDPKSAAT